MAKKKEYECDRCGTAIWKYSLTDLAKSNNRCASCNKEVRREALTEAQKGPKTCTKCKETKPRDEKHFPLHNKKVDGLDSWCRKCRATYRSETRRGQYRAMISDEQLKEEFKNFTGCAICGEKTEDIVVDHCHDKNVYRGLLCQLCNRGLGNFKDNTDSLKRAIEYLNK